MKLEELEKKYDELGAEIEKLKAEQDEKWPYVGDPYFSIGSDGAVNFITWVGNAYDDYRLATGNCHRTEEAAEAYRAWLTDPRAQARRMVEMCDGFDPVGGAKLNFWSDVFDTEDIPWRYAGLAFDTENNAKSAIDKLGVDLIKVALGVITGDEAQEIVMRAMRSV